MYQYLGLTTELTVPRPYHREQPNHNATAEGGEEDMVQQQMMSTFSNFSRHRTNFEEHCRGAIANVFGVQVDDVPDVVLPV